MSTNIGFAKPYPRIFGQAFIQGEKFFLEESGVIFRWEVIHRGAYFRGFTLF